jgi:hypothetical protein
MTESCTAICRLVMHRWQDAQTADEHAAQFLHFLKPLLSEPASICAPIDFHTQHTTVCEYSPHFLSLPLRIKLQLVVCNVCQTQAPISQTTTAVLSVRRPCTYTHVCNKHQSCYLSIFTFLSLFWNEKKNVGHYFLSNLRRSPAGSWVNSGARVAYRHVQTFRFLHICT